LDPSKHEATERLADGSVLTIRAIHACDCQRFARAFEEFAKSPDSVHFRFHGFKRSLIQREAVGMTDVDFVDHLALVGTFSADPLAGIQVSLGNPQTLEGRRRTGSRFLPLHRDFPAAGVWRRSLIQIVVKSTRAVA